MADYKKIVQIIRESSYKIAAVGWRGCDDEELEQFIGLIIQHIKQPQKLKQALDDLYKYSPGTIGLNKSWREHNCEDFNELNCDCYLPDMEYEECYCQQLRRERISTLDRRNYPEYTRWRASVFERDDYTCQICSMRGGELNAHHLKGYKHNPDKRIDINNGVTLCIECHRAVHKGVIVCQDRKKKG